MMSVSDPLIKDIKDYTKAFLEEIKEKRYITDESPTLVPFCTNLEKIFTNGLRKLQNGIYFNKQVTPYSWMLSLINDKCDLINFSYSYCVEKIEHYKNTTTDTGKLRLLVRLCLVQKCLHVPLEYLSKRKKNTLYYNQLSIIGDEILLEILLSVLLQYSKMTFHLDVDNASFLDYSWYLPTVLKFELVPADSLGLSVSFSGDKAIIVHIGNNSVAAEEDSINIGDVLDTLNGHYINSSLKGRLSTLLRSGKSQPVNLTLVKAIDPISHKLYLPIRKLLTNLKIEIDVMKMSTANRSEKPMSKLKKNSAGYKVTYIGLVQVGKYGDAKLITKAIQTLLSQKKNIGFYYEQQLPYTKVNKEVIIELQDLGVKVYDSETDEISACGSGNFLTNYFAYIAGDDVCNAANNFISHVFYTIRNEEACFIIQSMGQGFHRTHFAV